MEMMRETLLTLCGVSVIQTILEMLMPNGSVKNYARLVFAILLLVTMLRPIAQLYTLLMRGMPG